MKAIIFDFNRTIYDPESGVLNDGVLDALEILSKDYELFLVAKGGDKRKELIASLDIGKYFKKISILEEKSLEQFQECKQSLDPSTEWYVVGDRTRKEMKYGNQCNMTTIWFKDGKFAEELPEESIEEPNYTIQKFSEVMELV